MGCCEETTTDTRWYGSFWMIQKNLSILVVPTLSNEGNQVYFYQSCREELKLHPRLRSTFFGKHPCLLFPTKSSVVVIRFSSLDMILLQLSSSSYLSQLFVSTSVLTVQFQILIGHQAGTIFGSQTWSTPIQRTSYITSSSVFSSPFICEFVRRP